MKSKSKTLKSKPLKKDGSSRSGGKKRMQVQTTLKTDKAYQELFEDIVSIIKKAPLFSGKTKRMNAPVNRPGRSKKGFGK